MNIRKKRHIIYVILLIFVCFITIFNNYIFADNNHESHVVTEIDLTGLQTGTDTTHKHIYEKQYNSSQHWEECFICHNKINLSNHHLIEKWNLGRKDCYPNEFKTISCSDGCGYSKKETLSHISDGIIRHTNANSHWHYGNCTRCGYAIDIVRCRKADGTLITCANLGTCVDCGFTYTSSNSPHEIRDNGTCQLCNKKILKFENYTETKISNNQIKKTLDVYPVGENITFNDDWWLYSNQSNTIVTVSNCTYTTLPNNGRRLTGTMTFKDNVVGKASFQFVGSGKYNGQRYQTEMYHGNYYEADTIAPIIKNIKVDGNGTIDKFSQKATITVTASEERDKNLFIALYDEDGSIISDFGSAKDNGDGTFTKVIDVVAETKSSSTLTVKVKDSTGNITSKTCIISYLDAKAPTLVEYDKQTEWSKNKKITFYTNDTGSGNVQIAFNDLNDYSLADNFSGDYVKTYNFVGDVYGNVTGALYLKDAVGNETTQKVTISNIDNTAPTITKVSHVLDTKEPFATLSINEANDINTSLNKEGSGIIGYAIAYNDKEIPNKNMFTNSNQFKITENGTYYIYAIDLVGNISEPLEYNVNNIKWGNIQINLNKYITINNNILDIDTLKYDYKLNNQNLNFQLKVRNSENNKISTVYLSPENILNLSNLDIGTYEIVEIPHNLFSFSSFKNIKNNDTENITILNKNNSIIISVKKRFIDDKIVFIDSFSEIESPQVMGVSSYKNNYILFE